MNTPYTRRQVLLRFEIVTIGAELLDGTLADTNTAAIASRLARLGGEVVRGTTVPDEPDAIRESLEDALSEADAVVAAGGLGTTSDDLTKQVAARVFGKSLALDEDVLARVRSRFEERGRAMPEINVSQAMVPEGARPIPNRIGTAPGLVLEDDGRLLFLLPGVPAEMVAMLDEYVVPFLEGRGLRRTTEERVIRTTGISESALAEMIGPTARRLARTEISYLPSITGVDVRISCRAGGSRSPGRTADSAEERLAAIIGPYVYARGNESLEEVVGYLLTMQGKTISVAESCTGGLLGFRLTAVPGSSDYTRGGVIAYSNDLKKRLLKVKAGTLKKHGAVSGEVALEMAEGAVKRCRSDLAVSITGIAGPGGGTKDKPVGLVWMAVAAGEKACAREERFAGSRDAIRTQAAQSALDLLRRTLLGLTQPGERRA
ncbi:MAG: competence/damage-inducible protein A [Candidatus Eisenbacteria bacterium]|nr:competence/damage-inducible protein A [Candidatus Eisenbacteria bacterium]